jgi:hypothetical protein
MKRSIKDTHIFNQLGLTSKLDDIANVSNNLEENSLSKTQLEFILNDLKSKITFPIKNELISEITAKRIILINSSIPMFILPYWLIKNSQSETVVIINLFNKIKVKENDTLQYSIRDIFALIQAGYILKEFNTNENKFIFNTTLTKYSIDIYEKIVYKTLDTLYAIDLMSIDIRNKIHAAIRYFFLTVVMERPYNASLVLPPMLKGDMVEKEIQEANITDFESLFTYIQTLVRTVNIISFYEKFALTFSERSLLMLENYGYFISLISTVLVSGSILKDFVFHGIMGNKLMNDMYKSQLEVLR